LAPVGALLPAAFPTLRIRWRRFEVGLFDQYLSGDRDATRFCPFIRRWQWILDAARLCSNTPILSGRDAD
jgi:hypothetical protein